MKVCQLKVLHQQHGAGQSCKGKKKEQLIADILKCHPGAAQASLTAEADLHQFVEKNETAGKLLDCYGKYYGCVDRIDRDLYLYFDMNTGVGWRTKTVQTLFAVYLINCYSLYVEAFTERQTPAERASSPMCFNDWFWLVLMHFQGQ